MAFRRPRINVKPNVQASRPASSTVRSQETPASSQEEQPTQQIEITISPPTENEPIVNVEETTEFLPLPLPPPPPPPPLLPPPAPLPVEATPISIAPAPSPPPSSTPTARPFRRKVAPNLGVKTAILHRRPSASCSGTESESESTRQKHTVASTITFTRVPPSMTKSTISNETQPNLPSEPSINEEIPTPTKSEAMTTEISEISTSLNENNSSQIPSRTSSKISREYLTQHITYRAQRLAAKVEPDMTIRKRRAATLEKLDETGVNKGGPIDTSKLKIADFVHYNPTANPMEVKVKSTVDTSQDPVRKHSISSADGPNSILAPQLKIDANGALVVDEESLYIRNIDDTPRNTVIVEGQFNDDNLTHQSYRKIGRRKRWNNRDTLRFYQALRMCGTDFTLIARVFPNRDRDDIKRKFKTEDKANRTLIDSALRQRIPFDLTCFYSPSEDSTDEENESDREQFAQKKSRKRRIIKRKSRQTTSSDPLEINRRREKRLQARKNSTRVKKSAEFIDEDDDDDEDENEETSMDIADTVEVRTTETESKSEQIIPSNSQTDNFNGLENLLGQIDGGHLLFVHNTDETTGLDRIDVHVVRSNSTE